MEDLKMPITEHLGDLRKRISISLIALLVTSAAAFAVSEHILDFLMFPLKYSLDFSVREMYLHFVPDDKLGGNTKLVFLAPAEAFWMHIRISIVTGLILALPVMLYQFWKFISPGLLPKEKKYALPFVFSATGLFLFGAAFCFFIVLPVALGFLLTYKVGDFLMPMLSVGQYVNFILKFILTFGLVFELPIVIVFLTKTGIITPETLAKNRKYSIIIAFVLAAFLTPTPDAFSQILMAVPMLLLYEVGIWISMFLNRKKKRSE
jgi:sec-independent protein translocase protein TatC